MNADRLSESARGLDDAWARAATVPAPSTLEPSLTTADAHEIQDLVIDARVVGPQRPVSNEVCPR